MLAIQKEKNNTGTFYMFTKNYVLILFAILYLMSNYAENFLFTKTGYFAIHNFSAALFLSFILIAERETWSSLIIIALVQQSLFFLISITSISLFILNLISNVLLPFAGVFLYNKLVRNNLTIFTNNHLLSLLVYGIAIPTLLYALVNFNTYFQTDKQLANIEIALILLGRIVFQFVFALIFISLQKIDWGKFIESGSKSFEAIVFFLIAAAILFFNAANSNTGINLFLAAIVLLLTYSTIRFHKIIVSFFSLILLIILSIFHSKFSLDLHFTVLLLLFSFNLLSQWKSINEEKFAKLELEQEMLNVLMNQMPERIYFKDLDSRFIRINKAQADTLGIIEPELAIGKSESSFYPESNSISSYTEEQEIFRTGKPIYSKLELLKEPSNGAEWVSINKVPFKDSKGIIKGIAVIATNITHIKNIENDLRKSEEKYKLIFNESPVGIFQFDNNLVLTECNERIVQILGERKERLVGSKFERFFENKILLAISDLFDGKESHYDGYINSRNFSRNKWVKIITTPIFNEHKVVTGGVAIVEDVTARRMIEEELKNSEKRYRSLVDQAKDGIFISGPDGRLQDVNKAGCNMLGYLKDEILGLSLLDFERSHSSDASIGGIDEYNFNSYREIQIVKKDESTLNAEMISQILDDGRVLAIVRDITERKTAYNKIQRTIEELNKNKVLLEERSAELVVLNEYLANSEAELKEINATKDKFFSIVAHDLKSPFHGILGYSNLLLEDYEQLSKEDIKVYLTTINKSIINVYKFLENLLDWSRLQTGRMNCQIEKINVYTTVLYCINLVSANALNKGIKITNNADIQYNVKADERMLNSVLENLLSNAIKFTHTKGSISINAHRINSFIEISVEDSGVGMSQEIIELIFRVDKNHTTLGTEQEKGTGLGLVLCKDMIEKQGGAIQVKSEINKGTKISFILLEWNDDETRLIDNKVKQGVKNEY